MCSFTGSWSFHNVYKYQIMFYAFNTYNCIYQLDLKKAEQGKDLLLSQKTEHF